MKMMMGFVLGGWLVSAVVCFGQTTQPAPGTVAALELDLSATAGKMHETFPGLEELLKADKRKELAPKLIPILMHLSTDFDELAKLEPDKKEEYAQVQGQYLMVRAVLGDQSAVNALAELAASKKSDEAWQGRSEQLTVQWIESAKDPAAQSKVVDELSSVAKAHPESDDLTQQLLMLSQLGPATPQLQQRLEDLILNVMTDPAAEQVREQIVAMRKLKALENKPLAITGKLVDGKDFSTARWNGKVILVDFWATWCPPCRAELPRVIAAYNEYHGKGLEILGVSNDYAAADLTQFLSQNKEMAWPELFDPAAANQQQWSSTTLGLGIVQLPTIFLIDKKGIVRSVSAWQDFEELIPKMMAE